MTQILFQREVLIDAPLAHVWQLVATENGLRQWWGNTISIEPKEGGRCEEWRRGSAQSMHWQGVVTTYTPPHQLMMTLRAQEPQRGWPEVTTIAIALEAKGEQTRVHVTQRAFGAASLIGTEDQHGPVEQPAQPQPSQPQISPRAQLDRLPPGSVPAPLQTPSTGQIDPTYLPVHPQHKDELTLWWQRRFTSLAAASSLTHDS